MDTAQGSPAIADLAEATCVPIASLDPSQAPPEEKSIKAVVSLLWPYSSSHRTFALLLAEPDFRLRNNKGQIRIQLWGSIAEALAKSHIGIGDCIHLSLAGSQWVEDASTIKTPGRSVDANLLFKSRILLQIERDGEQLPILRVDRAESPPSLSPLAAATSVAESRSPPRETPEARNLSDTWRTPAKFRASFGTEYPLPSSSYGLFGDQDAFEERPIKRPRLWRDDAHWRLVDRDSSSSEEDNSKYSKDGLPQLDGSTDLGDAVDSTKDANAEMSPPKLPQIQTDIVTPVNRTAQAYTENLLAPSSPTLRPIESAVLPQVSPLSFFQDASLWHPGGPGTGQGLSQLETDQRPGRVGGITDHDPMQSVLSLGGLESSHSLTQENSFLSQSLISDSHQVSMESQGVIFGTAEKTSEVPKAEGKEVVTIDLVTEDEKEDEKEEVQLKESDSQKRSQNSVLLDLEEPVNLTHESFPESIEQVQYRKGYEVNYARQDPVSASQEQISRDLDIYSRAEPLDVTSQSLRDVEDSSPLVVRKDIPEARDLGQPTPDASQDTGTHMPGNTSIGHRVDDILDGRLPPTPQSSAIPLHMLEPSAPVSASETLIEGAETKKLLRSSKKSSNFRVSEVPEVLSTWFSSRRPSLPHDDYASKSEALQSSKVKTDKPTAPSPMVGFDFGTLSDRDQTSTMKHYKSLAASTNGFRTALSYYSPLSSLDRHVNDSSQVGENLVDVITVATSPTADQTRAKSGPKDYYTYLEVVDSSSFPETFLVQMFRPFKASLPVVDTGDVILLRNFAVKSRDRKCFLLSGKASSWCVWRNRQDSPQSEDKDIPIWARKKIPDPEASNEECKGPPVELGPEERQYASAMRHWWESLQGKELLADNAITNRPDLYMASRDTMDPSSQGIAVGT